jgi:hypothetical protein
MAARLSNSQMEAKTQSGGNLAKNSHNTHVSYCTKRSTFHMKRTCSLRTTHSILQMNKPRGMVAFRCTVSYPPRKSCCTSLNLVTGVHPCFLLCWKLCFQGFVTFFFFGCLFVGNNYLRPARFSMLNGRFLFLFPFFPFFSSFSSFSSFFSFFFPDYPLLFLRSGNSLEISFPDFSCSTV